MALPAGFRLLWNMQRQLGALRNTGLQVHDPGGSPTVIQVDLQAATTGEITGLRLCDVYGTRAMAGFAADRDFRVCCCKRVVRSVIAHLKIGRVALGAHEVPVLLTPGPVQQVSGCDVLVGIEVEPALTTVRVGTRIPGERQGLHAASREFNEVLLQRLDAEHIGDAKILQRTVLPRGPHNKTIVICQKTGSFTEVVELGISEVAEHAVVRDRLHGQLVVRTLPLQKLGHMAGFTNVTADERGNGRSCCNGLVIVAPATSSDQADACHNEQHIEQNVGAGPADCCRHQGGYSAMTFSACGPFWPSVTSIVTFCPSFKDLNPSIEIALWWTNTSLPSSRSINPNPLSSLNHLTVPETRWSDMSTSTIENAADTRQPLSYSLWNANETRLPEIYVV